MNIDGTGIKLNMIIGNSYNIEISGTAISGTLKYISSDNLFKRSLNIHATPEIITIKNSRGVNIKAKVPKWS